MPTVSMGDGMWFHFFFLLCAFLVSLFSTCRRIVSLLLKLRIFLQTVNRDCGRLTEAVVLIPPWSGTKIWHATRHHQKIKKKPQKPVYVAVKPHVLPKALAVGRSLHPQRRGPARAALLQSLPASPREPQSWRSHSQEYAEEDST